MLNWTHWPLLMRKNEHGAGCEGQWRGSGLVSMHREHIRSAQSTSRTVRTTVTSQQSELHYKSERLLNKVSEQS